MKNILLPTDFSDNSWNAIQYALELFKNEKCTFHLLHVYTPIIYNIEYFEVGAAQSGLIDSIKETATNNMDNLLSKINNQFKNENHNFSKIISLNTLVFEIEELFQANVMDFIVMGSQGATGLKKVLFGSNTIQVIKNGKCPVLAIPAGFTFETLHEILFPSDYEVDFTKKHLKLLMDLASLHSSRVNFLNVSYGYDLSEKQYQNKQKLEDSFKNRAHLFHSVTNQNVTEAISDFQLKVKVNLLVMINNKNTLLEKLFFKSKINQIGFHLNIPFLVLPS